MKQLLWNIWFSLWNQNEHFAKVWWYSTHTRKLMFNTKGRANWGILAIALLLFFGPWVVAFLLSLTP